jgi:hypothetical protein
MFFDAENGRKLFFALETSIVIAWHPVSLLIPSQEDFISRTSQPFDFPA